MANKMGTKIAAYQAAYYRRNKEMASAYSVWHGRRRRLRRRVEAQLKLGGKCVRCDFDHDYRALQIDHIWGSGRKSRRHHDTSEVALRDVLGGNTKDYQLLCANCNWIKKYEMDEN